MKKMLIVLLSLGIILSGCAQEKHPEEPPVVEGETENKIDNVPKKEDIKNTTDNEDVFKLINESTNEIYVDSREKIEWNSLGFSQYDWKTNNELLKWMFFTLYTEPTIDKLIFEKNNESINETKEIIEKLTLKAEKENSLFQILCIDNEKYISVIIKMGNIQYLDYYSFTYSKEKEIIYTNEQLLEEFNLNIDLFNSILTENENNQKKVFHSNEEHFVSRIPFYYEFSNEDSVLYVRNNQLYYVYLTTISDENYTYDHIVLDEINLSEWRK